MTATSSTPPRSSSTATRTPWSSRRGRRGPSAATATRAASPAGPPPHGPRRDARDVRVASRRGTAIEYAAPSGRGQGFEHSPTESEEGVYDDHATELPERSGRGGRGGGGSPRRRVRLRSVGSDQDRRPPHQGRHRRADRGVRAPRRPVGDGP